VRPEPSRFYHAAPGACPYHLIIGVDRRPPNKVACTSARNVRKDESTESVSAFADHYGLSVTLMSLVIRAAKVRVRPNSTYRPEDVAAAMRGYYPGPDVSTMTDTACALGIHPKQFYELVRGGFINPTIKLCGIALYSREAAAVGLYARRCALDLKQKKLQAELAASAKANKAKGWKQ